MSNVDLDFWEEILTLLVASGHEVHWPQVPSHTGICGNHKVDERRMWDGVLLGHVSVNMVGGVDEGEDEEEEFDE